MTYSIGHTNDAYYYGTDYGRHTPIDQYLSTIPVTERHKYEEHPDD